MLSCHNIADYFLSLQDEGSGDHITNLKLQKLVYYAQGYFLAIFDKPLFDEPIEAWQHGPVVSDLYHRFKEFGSSAIVYDNQFDIGLLDAETKELLDEVYNVFNQFSGWALRNMTHEEAPWKNHEADASVISTEELKTFFKTKLN